MTPTQNTEPQHELEDTQRGRFLALALAYEDFGIEIRYLLGVGKVGEKVMLVLDCCMLFPAQEAQALC